MFGCEKEQTQSLVEDNKSNNINQCPNKASFHWMLFYLHPCDVNLCLSALIKDDLILSISLFPSASCTLSISTIHIPHIVLKAHFIFN